MSFIDPGTYDAAQLPDATARRKINVLLVSSVALAFISFWRSAAIVLCDLASTAYYIGGISEQAIGKAAPWFILGVMLFSYAVRASMWKAARCLRAAAYTESSRAHGRQSGQALRQRADVRLCPHRADQRRVGRAIHHRPWHRYASTCSPP